MNDRTVKSDKDPFHGPAARSWPGGWRAPFVNQPMFEGQSLQAFRCLGSLNSDSHIQMICMGVSVLSWVKRCSCP